MIITASQAREFANAGQDHILNGILGLVDTRSHLGFVDAEVPVSTQEFDIYRGVIIPALRTKGFEVQPVPGWGMRITWGAA